MSTDIPRWVLILVVVACIVGLVAWARGEDHHRGEDIGARAASATATLPEV